MNKLIEPPKLKKGDTVATVSLSWGGAGDEEILWRYKQGKEQLEKTFGLKVVEMPHTLKGSEFVYNHPELRARDLMDALKNSDIKAIITCIGGMDSIRMLPYIDFNVIRDNPKIFMGYSDSTITHLLFNKAGVSSIYGPTLLMDLAENNGILTYTVEYMVKALFNIESIGVVKSAPEWTSEHLPWIVENKDISRKLKINSGYEVVQGHGEARGHLLGGCIEVFDFTRGTDLFPSLEAFDGAILFFETSEDKPDPWIVESILRTYGMMGILSRINGLLLGKPMDEKYYDEYKDVIKKVLAEFDRSDLAVLSNLNFGHTEPKCALPYGNIAKIDCNKVSLELL